ncbi:nucleotidyltransferase family protein [Rathayibacter iranicus]|uniref:Polymerase nucleotidyl transferase domain-containing protein n=1 Tax=Rathayibacter iranicus TaxID=59737 RepID=A0AAD1ENE4_9MICO|nr:hypothetical protein [Rathayibacter iranicus]AZZ57177.1 hypothetical protein C7V51_15845 [Rathayibacter iranicus]MWV29812.1 hypothetical protein [Rathayibacter iranicus NCPPB 2253 = VKM Ac-1602]PPI41202.1 hypothetical protein C5E09_14710 [Rathayibacter iranicus]PPI57448.1 hypothetical protein C5E08_15600 [Rathayibacter iranicus]PPI68313.1 hypothetical protein C5E01_14650 [Rathayibacter iranicus]
MSRLRSSSTQGARSYSRHSPLPLYSSTGRRYGRIIDAHTDDGGTTAPPLEDLRSHRAELLALTTSAGITALSVIGSVAQERSTRESDIDLLVDADPQTSYFSLAAFARRRATVPACWPSV